MEFKLGVVLEPFRGSVGFVGFRNFGAFRGWSLFPFWECFRFEKQRPTRAEASLFTGTKGESTLYCLSK